jgi:hypothetical protein
MEPALDRPILAGEDLEEGSLGEDAVGLFVERTVGIRSLLLWGKCMGVMFDVLGARNAERCEIGIDRVDRRDKGGFEGWNGGSNGEALPSLDNVGETVRGTGRNDAFVVTRGLCGDCALILLASCINLGEIYS